MSLAGQPISAQRIHREEAMTDDQILEEFRAAEALLDGHFILSSGLRCEDIGFKLHFSSCKPDRYTCCPNYVLDSKCTMFSRWI